MRVDLLYFMVFFFDLFAECEVDFTVFVQFLGQFGLVLVEQVG